MWTLLDIRDYIICDCLFCCYYDLSRLCNCFSVVCNLSYDISLDMIELGLL